MKTNLLFTLIAAFVMSSCSNIDIVKRVHRPGYHVEVTKKSHKSTSHSAAKRTKEETIKLVDVAKPTLLIAENQDVDAPKRMLITSVADNGAILNRDEVKAMETEKSLQQKARDGKEFAKVDFGRYFHKKRRSVLDPIDFGSARWSDWVTFGAGLGAITFGVVGLITAFFGFTFWPLAIFFGAAAVTMYILAKKNAWAGSEGMQKLGFIFGIVGAGLGLAGMILWAIGYGSFRRRGYYWRRP